MKRIFSLLLALIMTVSVFAGAASAETLSGDCSGDGKLNNKDVIILFRYVSGSPENAVVENCDFNNDGKINNKDVTTLFRYVSSLPKTETVFIDFKDAADDNVLSFFTKKSNCEISFVTDEDEGTVLKISAKGIVNATSKPIIFFRYSDYSKSIYEEPASFIEKPFVVLKVKALNVHDRMFYLTGSESDKSVKPANEASAKIPGGDGWHYICFDFSGAETPEKFNAFRIVFEQIAGENGETVLISEMRVCTAEEAALYTEEEVYPVQEQTMEDYRLKVMQFNIQTENGNGAPISTRSEMYRKLIDELQPDVVGMQEVTVNWRKWLDTYVFNDSYEGVGAARSTDASQGIEANPIYYRKDKFELVESGTFWLSDTPETVGSMYDDSNYPRICTWALLRDKSTGAEFVHMNTHLDQNGQSPNKETGGDRRKRQIGVIIKFAQRFDKDLPMLLTGDLNNRRTTSEGKTYALIKMIQGQTQYTDADGNKYSIALSDTRLNAPVTVDENHAATMTKNYDITDEENYNPKLEPIDYIFYNQKSMSALTYETFLISQNGAWISDHLPLYATFRIKPAITE